MNDEESFDEAIQRSTKALSKTDGDAWTAESSFFLSSNHLGLHRILANILSLLQLSPFATFIFGVIAFFAMDTFDWKMLVLTILFALFLGWWSLTMVTEVIWVYLCVLNKIRPEKNTPNGSQDACLCGIETIEGFEEFQFFPKDWALVFVDPQKQRLAFFGFNLQAVIRMTDIQELNYTKGPMKGSSAISLTTYIQDKKVSFVLSMFKQGQLESQEDDLGSSDPLHSHLIDSYRRALGIQPNGITKEEALSEE